MLVSSRAKLFRAGRQINEAHGISDAFLDGEFYRSVQETDSEGHLVARIVEVLPFPGDFGLCVGDAVHNIRSALDHIAFRLSAPADRKQAGQVAFPTISDQRDFLAAVPRRLPGVSAEALALFEKYQPYNSGKLPATRLLAQVASLNNWDKHRALPIAWASVGKYFDVEVSFTGNIEIASQEFFEGRLHVGATLTRLEIVRADAGSKVNVKMKPAFRPVFDESMPDVGGLPVLETLLAAGEFIFDTIIPDFERLL
jgi:hypothetical protein